MPLFPLFTVKKRKKFMAMSHLI